METHLRLAERQGLLQGRDLSPLQQYALILLRFLDAKERGKARSDAVKNALIATGHTKVSDLYPEWFPQEPEEDDGAEDVTYDYSEVEWKGGTDAMSEYQRLMAQVEQSSTVTITAADDSGGEWM